MKTRPVWNVSVGGAKENPRISIIVPVFNSEKTIEAAIKSVLSQTYQEYELVFVDGRSTDTTLKIIQAHRKNNYSWVSEPDLGVYDAMNKGARLAKGDWIYFLGADDTLNDSLHTVAPYLRNPRIIYYGDVFLPHKNKIYAGEFKWHTLISKNINHQSIFYPRRVFEKYSYNLEYPLLADYELNLRLWGEKKFKFQYMPIVIAVHNDGGLSNQKVDENFLRDKPALVKRHFGRRMALRVTWHRLRGFAGGLLRAVFGNK